MVAEGAAWVELEVEVEVEVTRGVELAGTVIMLELGVGVAVTEFTLTRVLVTVIVANEVVSSAATNWAAARQRKEVTRAPNCIFADCCMCRMKEACISGAMKTFEDELILWVCTQKSADEPRIKRVAEKMRCNCEWKDSDEKDRL